MNKKLLLGIQLLLAIGLAGCAAGPDYQGPPKIELGEKIETETLSHAPAITLDRWWEKLGDETLKRLVNQALNQNHDIQIAILRIQESRAYLMQVSSLEYPSLDTSASVNSRRQSLNGPMPAINGRDQVIHNIGLAASWEPDLFGRIQRTIESSTAQLEATQADAEGVWLSISTEVTRNYLQLGSLKLQRDARKKHLDALNETRKIIKKRVELGDLPLSELDQTLIRIKSIEADLPIIESNIRSTTLALSTLTGALPEKEILLEHSPYDQIQWPQIPVGKRVDILERRPDIRSAERRLATSSANKGLAMAEKFPRLIIGASGGFETLHRADLFKNTSQFLSIVPLISWNIFDGGRVEAQIQATSVNEEIATLRYTQTVIKALSDVERSLNRYKQSHDAWNKRNQVQEYAEKVYDLAKQRYIQGDISRYDLLESERQYLDASEAQIKASGEVAEAMIQSIRALGGGWRFSA